MEPLKEMYNRSFYERLSKLLQPLVPGFRPAAFLGDIHTDAFADMELKERMRHTTKVLHGYLPGDFGVTMQVFDQLIASIRAAGSGNSFAFMFLPDYIEVYGIEEYALSVAAIERVTQFISCEFAVRPFLLKYGLTMVEQLISWSRHPHYAVRRLSSEGLRPRLPWGLAVPYLKADPSVLFPMLEQLKHDPHEWVRKSVANHINDIAKDHPAVVVDIAKRWLGHSKETDAIVKHACRTLFKQGHPEILALYKLDSQHIRVEALSLQKPTVKVGGALTFAFDIRNQHADAQEIRIEYAVYFLRNNGTLYKKVFKISERILEGQEVLSMTKQHSFKPITTRTYYPGVHQVSVIINGKEMDIATFELTAG
ncbi:DNA alkylation repair protein [Chitinophaga pendula]|uniref:DNA alkylation repair protein n=1 Tax=Chitinophaga TaxID=79328 RepID=UPI000BB098A3|nr:MULTISPECIES: DNA alkylation repair protein [Chitinophaga]ASZ12624.1 DNA alkylation repair protein [Chitinophaga sp. MD30]UCJ09768.1 DNA alkylation repair protein [Chitinophaga pendula]